jgi:hypothetical protein
LAALGAITFLLCWAGWGYDHQVVQQWATIKQTPTFFSEHIVSEHHHGLGGVIAACAGLGVAWTLLLFATVAMIHEAWNGYDGW